MLVVNKECLSALCHTSITLKPPYSIMHNKLPLAIWDTSFWTFLLKFEHRGP